MRYVFRLTTEGKKKLDEAAPPKTGRGGTRSAFIREAILKLLCKPKRSLTDRPHLRGREGAYTSVCALLDEDQIEAIKKAYPEVSVSVVIQAAVTSALKSKSKIAGSTTAGLDDNTTKKTVLTDAHKSKPARQGKA
jgi:Arc/MetJ-type ribon-helix-helix transcriptional regulator